MAEATLDDARMKALVKDALVELLQERGELLRGIIAEALEDAGMVQAIRQGQETPLASRAEVFEALGRAS